MSNTSPQNFDIAAWRTAASESFGQLNVSAPNPGQFWATLASAAVSEVSLFDMHTSAHTVTRPGELIARDDAPFCKLSLQLSGTSTMTQDGRTCELHAGDLALYVTDRPYTLDYPVEQHTLVVHFPESFLHLSPAQIRQITASPISREHGLGKVAVPLFEQLAYNLDVLEGPHASALVHSALNLLVAVLSSELAAQDSSPANLLFNQATAYIDKHLADPDLSPSTIAQALFVSVRHLHSHFAAHDLSVGTYIRTRRLDRIRGELGDPLHSKDSIGTISARYGLHDPSHFSRIFKAEYKESPSAYRSRTLSTA
ncbi:TPA: helix-turn-helix domain-containing protein [Corynebacterium striatum]|uniref:AraC-like ligand-binding domain-containing protein n=1 Tax=Corynebacterium TaxID=1716 RepID=UPI0011C8D28A|nr:MULTISPECIES: helix-turn-helix domain-containing protein [Corynebacterium]TXS66221.1 AraC family transcriptional regulator [Corynebacterium sp. LK14]HBC7266419.1 helix-turn-helix domain-containing protein [Corynebacterium striatum]